MQVSMMRRAAVWLVVLALVVCVPRGFAQGSGTCTVTGTVYDESGALIPEAKVRLILQTTGTARETTADTSGFFSVVGIPPGTYDLRVEAQGFAGFAQKGIVLHINDQVDLKSIVLKVGAVAAAVEVSGAPAEVVPVSSGEVSYTITSDQVQNLAIVGRNVIELVKMLPGAQNSGGWNGQYSGEVSAFNLGAGAYTVNGNRFNMLAVVSDGGNVTDHGFNGGSMVTPNVDMIQEVKVQTSNYSAENPNGPVVMETVTKSGGKDFHGEGYYSIRDSSMNANDWQNNRYALGKPGSRFQNPGFNLGGPVLLPGTSFNKQREKLFFFAGFEWMRQAVDLGVHRAIVPTAAMRTGDFSNVAGLQARDASGTPISNFVNTAVCQPDSSGKLASYCASAGKLAPSAIDPGGQVLMNLYPQPNADPLSSGGFNYFSDIINPQPRVQQLVKIDYAATDSTHFSARYNHEAETIPYPYGLWQFWPQIAYPGGVLGADTSQSLALNLTNILSPSLTNQLTVTLNHLFYGNGLSTPGKVSASKLGYPYYGVFNNGLDLIPNVGGGNGIGDIYDEGGVVPNQNAPKWTATLSESISKVIGTHLLKGGFYWSRITTQQRTGGKTYVDQGSITLANWATLTGNGYADLLLGHISGFDQGTKNVQTDYAANEYDFFALDTWKIGRRLTLNYGARLNHMGWWYNQEGRIAVFDPTKYNASAPISAYTGIQTHANDPSVPLSGYKPVSFQFAPSVGFAWDVTGSGKTVVRGGFGVNYFRDEGNTAAFSLVLNPPFLVMNYYYPGGGLYLKDLPSLAASAPALPWPSVAVADESKMPRTYSYSFSVARRLAASTTLQFSYVGNFTRYLVGWPDTNPVPEGAELDCCWGWPSQSDDPTYRKYQNIAGIYPAAHVLRSNYNSLQVTASRTTGPVNYWVAYTFGKALGHNVADSFDLSRGYGPLPWDRTQALKFSYNINLPAVSKKHLGDHPVLNGVLDGWQVSGISEFDSGAPMSVLSGFPGGYTINMADTQTGTAAWRFTGRYIDGTPDESPVPLVICDPGSNLGPHQIFNAACFQAPTHGNNGTYRPPYIHGPWYNNNDLSLFKNFPMGESRKLQVRAEAFNFLNHALWGFASNDPALQLQIKDFGAAPVNAATAGVMTNKFGHRIVQFAVKFFF